MMTPLETIFLCLFVASVAINLLQWSNASVLRDRVRRMETRFDLLQARWNREENRQ